MEGLLSRTDSERQRLLSDNQLSIYEGERGRNSQAPGRVERLALWGRGEGSVVLPFSLLLPLPPSSSCAGLGLLEVLGPKD